MKITYVSLPVILFAAALSGCTSISVKPVAAATPMNHVCIEKNPKVLVSDFISVLQEGFDRHGISTEVFEGTKPDNCEYTLTYTALRNWDMAIYLTHAEIYLRKNGTTIASANYHLRLDGGLALTKYQGTKTKMDPVIDQLLQEYKITSEYAQSGAPQAS